MRRLVFVGLLTLVAGGFMMAGGFLLHTSGWGTGARVMLPSGPIIAVAFAALRMSERSWHVESDFAARRPTTRGRAITEIEVFVLTMAAGCAMAFGGYGAAAWNWLLVLPLAFSAGGIITAAFLLSSPGLRHSIASHFSSLSRAR